MNPYLSRKSLAKALEIGESTVDDMVRAGRIPAPRTVNGKSVWVWAEVDRALVSFPAPSTQPGIIYALGCGPYVKIGYTAGELSYRMAALQTGAPEKLEVLRTIDGTMADERALHRRFAQYRTFGEWFRREGEVLAWLEGSSQ